MRRPLANWITTAWVVCALALAGLYALILLVRMVSVEPAYHKARQLVRSMRRRLEGLVERVCAFAAHE